MRIFSTVAMACLLVVSTAHADYSRIGWVEKVGLDDAPIVVKARMDTGAGMTSVHAEILEFRKPAKPGMAEQVVFRIGDGEHSKTIVSDVVEWQNIKRKEEDGFIRRPVVRMGICIGNKKIRGRVNLADRSNFLYPVLVGRNFLKGGDFVVDPRKTFRRKPICESNGLKASR